MSSGMFSWEDSQDAMKAPGLASQVLGHPKTKAAMFNDEAGAIAKAAARHRNEMSYAPKSEPSPPPKPAGIFDPDKELSQKLELYETTKKNAEERIAEYRKQYLGFLRQVIDMMKLKGHTPKSLEETDPFVLFSSGDFEFWWMSILNKEVGHSYCERTLTFALQEVQNIPRPFRKPKIQRVTRLAVSVDDTKAFTKSWKRHEFLNLAPPRKYQNDDDTDLKRIQLTTRFGELIDYEFVFRAICDKMHEDLRAFVEDGIDKATAITERLNLNLKF